MKYLYLKKVSEHKKEIIAFFESNEKLSNVCDVRYDFGKYQVRCMIYSKLGNHKPFIEESPYNACEKDVILDIIRDKRYDILETRPIYLPTDFHKDFDFYKEAFISASYPFLHYFMINRKNFLTALEASLHIRTGKNAAFIKYLIRTCESAYIIDSKLMGVYDDIFILESLIKINGRVRYTHFYEKDVMKSAIENNSIKVLNYMLDNYSVKDEYIRDFISYAVKNDASKDIVTCLIEKLSEYSRTLIYDDICDFGDIDLIEKYTVESKSVITNAYRAFMLNNVELSSKIVLENKNLFFSQLSLHTYRIKNRIKFLKFVFDLI